MNQLPAQQERPQPWWRFWEGPRGEGWVVIQAWLLLAYLVAPRLGAVGPQPPRVVLAFVGVLMTVGGAVLFVAGAVALGRNLTPLPRPTESSSLVERGPYRWVRHPIYGGLVLLAVGGALATAHTGRLAVAGAVLAFLAAKANREEAWLRERYAGYPAYARRVRRLIPWVY